MPSTSERIAAAIGCEPYSDTSRRVMMRMMASCPTPIADLDDRRFRALAWRAFGQVRERQLSAGGDDPIWDLIVAASLARDLADDDPAWGELVDPGRPEPDEMEEPAHVRRTTR